MASDWIDCNQYKLDIRRGERFRPAMRFGFNAYDLDGTRYDLSIVRTNDRPAIAKKVLKVLSDIWPNREFRIKANAQKLITDIRV